MKGSEYYDMSPEEIYGDRDEHITGYCPGCGCWVTSVQQDFGIGSYEFWGARGVHHDWREVCPLCDYEVEDEFSFRQYQCETCIYRLDDFECRWSDGPIGEQFVDGNECGRWEGRG